MVMRRYTEEEHKFLQSFIFGHSYREIVEAFNKEFGGDLTLKRLKSYIHNRHLNTGRTGRFEKGHIPANKGKHTLSVGRMVETQYKKGNLPHNTKPIGYERLSKDGYIEVKIKMRPSPHANDNFVPKHRLIWEQHYGAIPKGSKIMFLDGDKRNIDIENLAVVTSRENLELTRRNLRYDDPDLTKTGIMIAKAGMAVKNKKKGQGNEKSTNNKTDKMGL